MLRAMQAPAWCAERVAIDWPAASPATAPTRTRAVPISTWGANVLALRSVAPLRPSAGRELPLPCPRAGAVRGRLGDALKEGVMDRQSCAKSNAQSLARLP